METTANAADEEAAHAAVGTGSRLLLLLSRVLTDDKTAKRHKLPWYLINPTGTMMAAWDGLTSVALIFTALATPFEVGFLPTARHFAEPLFLTNRIIDLIFIIDMVKEFFLTFPTQVMSNASQQELETSMRVIALRYLKGWLCLDLASIFPSIFDILPVIDAMREDGGGGAGAATSGSPVKALRVVRALRLVKLLRLLRASRVLGRLEVRQSTPRLTVTVVRIAFLSLIFGHVLACILGMLVAFADTPLDSWAATFGYCSPLATLPNMERFPADYTISGGGSSPTSVCVGPWSLYFQCYWWSLGLITTATIEPTFGPFEPHYSQGYSMHDSLGQFSYLEQLLQVAFIMAGIFYLTIVTGVFVEAISNADPDLVEYRQVRWRATTFLESWRCSWLLGSHHFR